MAATCVDFFAMAFKEPAAAVDVEEVVVWPDDWPKGRSEEWPAIVEEAPVDKVLLLVDEELKNDGEELVDEELVDEELVDEELADEEFVDGAMEVEGLVVETIGVAGFVVTVLLEGLYVM